jgi:hypothetical protein
MLQIDPVVVSHIARILMNCGYGLVRVVTYNTFNWI